MSYMKRFLEDVADELGLPVDDDEVLFQAQEYLDSGELPSATRERAPVLTKHRIVDQMIEECGCDPP